MTDKQIRDILIAYLTVSQDCRVYQEKIIGCSICDVMAVTDKLTGYEIKSDNDNYQRLERQIKDYDRFFDRNYIVVGRTHLKSVESKVPHYWGILLIDNVVTVIRKATKNKRLSLNDKLSFLWKSELKEILLKNGLPTYTSKSKLFIRTKLIEKVSAIALREQIAEQLKLRNYTIYNVKMKEK